MCEIMALMKGVGLELLKGRERSGLRMLMVLIFRRGVYVYQEGMFARLAS